MRTWLFFLSFKSWRVYLKVSFAILSYIPIVFNFVKAVALLIFNIISMADKCDIILFPTIFILKNTRIHVSSLNISNVISYIKASVN